MRKLFEEPLTYIGLYFVIAIFTFGHCWNQVPEKEQHFFAGQEYTVHNGPGTKMMASVASAAAWPLYWSVKVQE